MANPFEDLIPQIQDGSQTPQEAVQGDVSPTPVPPVEAPEQTAPAASNPFQDLVPTKENLGGQSFTPEVPKETISLKETFDRDLDAMAESSADLGEGIYEGIKAAGRKAELLIRDIGESVGIFDEGGAKRRRGAIATATKGHAERSRAFRGGKFIGEFGAEALPATRALKAVGLVGSGIARGIGAGALSGAAFGGLADPGQEGSRLKGAAIGAGLGAGLGGALGGIGRALGTSPQARAHAEQARQLSKEFSVDLSVGQARGHEVTQAVEATLKNIPLIGTRKFFRGQLAQVQRAGQQVVDDLRPTSGSIDEGTVGVRLVNSLQKRLTKVNRIESKLYTKAGKNLDKKIPSFTPNTAKQVAQEEINRLQSGLLPEAQKKMSSTIKLMQNVSDMKAAKFSEVHSARQMLDDILSAAEKKTTQGAITKEQVRSLHKVRQALEGDLERVAGEAGGAGGRAYLRAKQFYINEKLPLNEVNIKKAIVGDKINPEDIVDRFIKPNKPTLAKKLVRNLDKEGRETLEWGILSKAYRKSVDPTKIDGFNPIKFTKEVNKLGKTAGIVFKPKTRKALNGFTKLIRLVEDELKDPSLTARVIAGTSTMVGGGGLLFASQAPLAAGVLGSTFVISKLLTTRVGQKLLVRTSNATANSKFLKDLVTRIVQAGVTDELIAE